MKVGLIAFMNSGGLSAQTRRLAQMLNPYKILLIDSSGFSPNKKQYPKDYENYNYTITKGFPKNHDINTFIRGLTHVLTVENPYNFYLIHACKEAGIKTIVQTNYEFCENIQAPWLPTPDLFLMPSYWKIKEMSKYDAVYLPPPINVKEFESARKTHKNKFLHIVGTLAFKDRNGTLDLLKAIKGVKKDFKLVIKSQHELPSNYIIKDSRVFYKIGNVRKNVNLYKGFKALILPRRYGGLSLTTNEALMSGLPVMMPDISPNNKLLPKQWLVPAKLNHIFQARASIECYSVNIKALTKKISEWIDFIPYNFAAFPIAIDNFSMNVLRPKYMRMFAQI